MNPVRNSDGVFHYFYPMSDSQKIYGIRAIIEAVESGQPIQKVFLQKGLKGDLIKKLESLLLKNKISSSYVPTTKLHQLTDKNHQGAVALISPVSYYDFEALMEEVVLKKEKPFLLLLDGITDVRNFGAIIRTAECAGVDAIVVPKSGAAPLNNDTIKTSAGAAFKVPIAKVDHLKDAIYYLKSSGFQILAATEKTDDIIYTIAPKDAIAVIMGSEEKGISPAILKEADHLAKIPLMGSIGSLNVSVACGIFLYEVVRQRMI